MTLPADTRLNDTPAGGPLTAADFDAYITKETAMLIGRDTEFQDTMAMPRRQSAPMDYRPTWYKGGLAACTSDACTSGDKHCKTPDACRLPEKVVGARIGFAALLVSAALVLVVIGWLIGG